MTTQEVRDLLQDHHANSPADQNDPDTFADARARHGLAIVSCEALAEMEAATEEALRRASELEASRDNWRELCGAEPAPLDIYAVVDLLGHTRRTGRLTNCAEIPGLVQLTETDGTVRLVNPHKAIFEARVVTEAQAKEFARPARPAWDSARGRLAYDYDEDEDGEDDPPFGDEE
jgi:hypothetical protein